jgi:hypothetical protein
MESALLNLHNSLCTLKEDAISRAPLNMIHAGDNATKFYGNGEAADHYTHA